jgi:succinate dehydrogenase/fumarate reductase flavoprotein subunit
MKVIYTDVLVIGGGLAGLRIAIGARRRGHDAIILSLVPAKRSHSKAAQGGMQASLGNVIKGQGDNEDVHFEDTVRGSDWGADQQVVRMFVNTAPKAVRELAAWGVPWSRVRKGDRQVIINGQKVTITERDEAHGLISQRDFGGTKKWRTCHVSDGTGHAMLQAVADQAIASGVPVHERTEALALIHDGSRCFGAVVRNLITGELTAYVARATAIATGGAGRVYRVTTNAVICEGIGAALALETGVAALGNMEAVQFHPSSSPRVAAAMVACCATRTATASCRTTSPRRRSSLRATSCRAAWKSTSARARAPSRVLASTCGSTSRCSARSTSRRSCARSTRSARASSAPTRPRTSSRCDRRSTTPWAGCARSTLARAQRCAGCSPRARRPAGTCTASTGSAATRSPRPWWLA